MPKKILHFFLLKSYTSVKILIYANIHLCMDEYNEAVRVYDKEGINACMYISQLNI